MIFVTGAAGFIGSNFVHHLKSQESNNIVILDKLTYAGSTDNLNPLTLPLEIVDIADKKQLPETQGITPFGFLYHLPPGTNMV